MLESRARVNPAHPNEKNKFPLECVHSVSCFHPWPAYFRMHKTGEYSWVREYNTQKLLCNCNRLDVWTESNRSGNGLGTRNIWFLLITAFVGLEGRSFIFNTLRKNKHRKRKTRDTKLKKNLWWFHEKKHIQPY